MITTDLTIQEVAKKHAENDYKVIKHIGEHHFRKTAAQVLGIKLPMTTKSEIKEKLLSSYSQSTKDMFKRLNCKVLPIDDVESSAVFSSYIANTGFFTYEGKKNQFPDAFIFKCLQIEASESHPITIVSSDKDFKTPVENEICFSLVSSLPELFETLGLKFEAPELLDFYDQHEEEFVEAINDELTDYVEIVDVEDARIAEILETTIKSRELTSFDVRGEGNSIFVIGSFLVDAQISYIHPDWESAMYDPEEERSISFWNVRGETKINLNLSVLMSITVDEEGSPDGIDQLEFLNGPQRIELHPTDACIQR